MFTGGQYQAERLRRGLCSNATIWYAIIIGCMYSSSCPTINREPTLQRLTFWGQLPLKAHFLGIEEDASLW